MANKLSRLIIGRRSISPPISPNICSWNRVEFDWPSRCMSFFKWPAISTMSIHCLRARTSQSNGVKMKNESEKMMWTDSNSFLSILWSYKHARTRLMHVFDAILLFIKWEPNHYCHWLRLRGLSNIKTRQSQFLWTIREILTRISCLTKLRMC